MLTSAPLIRGSRRRRRLDGVVRTIRRYCISRRTLDHMPRDSAQRFTSMPPECAPQLPRVGILSFTLYDCSREAERRIGRIVSSPNKLTGHEGLKSSYVRTPTAMSDTPLPPLPGHLQRARTRMIRECGGFGDSISPAMIFTTRVKPYDIGKSCPTHGKRTSTCGCSCF